MSLQLRGYQDNGLNGLRQGFADGHQAQILYLATGGGKSEIAIEMMDAARKKGTRSAMLLDRRMLCEQTSQRLDKYGIPHGVIAAGHWRWRPSELIQICMSQTIEKMGAFPDVQLLIVDECHDKRLKVVEFIKSGKVKTVGLSATPFTKGLGQIYSNVVLGATTEFLVGEGNLVPLRVFQAKQIDMTGAKKVAGEWSDKEATERGVKITGDVVTEWVRKTNELFGGPRKTIVFSAGIAHGEDLARKFSEAGYNFVSISANDDDEFKAAAVKEFAKPDSNINGLIATDILTKGFDVGDVMIGVSARPFSKSLSSHIQQMGRVMRPYPGKEFAAWLDHSGNYLRFQSDWEEIYSDGPGALDDGREKAKPEPTERDKKAALCPKCGSIFPGHQDVCSHCGHVRMRHNGVVVLPGELQEILRQEKSAKDGRQQFYSELLGLANERNYKAGWAFHKFREKFGAKPAGLRETPCSAGAATVAWVTSRNIRYAKGQAKSFRKMPENWGEARA